MAVPELPEVEALAAFLRENAVGRTVIRSDVAAFSVIKTFAPRLTALNGLTVTGASRYGKFLDLEVDGLHLVTHLSRAGWLQWREKLSPAPPKPGRGPLAFRLHLAPALDYDSDPDAPPSGFDLTEAELSQLYAAIQDELTGAIARAEGLAAKDLKGEKKSGLRVHGRKGETCDVCGDTIAEVSFADSSLQYCPTCQTGGKKLADRRLSKLLK